MTHLWLDMGHYAWRQITNYLLILYETLFICLTAAK
jgi:hypothetical protein